MVSTLGVPSLERPGFGHPEIWNSIDWVSSIKWCEVYFPTLGTPSLGIV